MKLTMKFAALTTIAALSLVGCSSDNTAEKPSSKESTQASAQGFTVDNCGFEMTFEQPVSRALTLRQGATETLLEMGLENQMVGTAGLRTPVADHNKAAFDTVPIVSESVPKLETIIDFEPDFLVSDRAAYYQADQSGTREELLKNGIYSFVSNTDCRGAADMFESLEKDFEQLGQIFGAEEAAKKVIDKQRDAIKKAQDTVKGIGDVRIASIYSIYEGEIYSDGARSPFQAVTDALGIENVYSTMDEQRPTIAWEAFADNDPDYIVLGDLSARGKPGDSPEDKIAMLKENPATKNMKAVAGDKFIIVPGAALDPSSRSIEVLNIVAEALAKDK